MTNTTISIDDRILKEARVKFKGQISAICERALKLRINPKKSDAPEDAIELKCMKCDTIVESGFLCKSRNLFLCRKCELATKPIGQHGRKFKNSCSMKECEHILIPGFNRENIEIAKEIAKKPNNKKNNLV